MGVIVYQNFTRDKLNPQNGVMIMMEIIWIYIDWYTSAVIVL